GPADTHVPHWIEGRANELLRAGAGIKRVSFAVAIKADTTHQEDFVLPYVQDLRNVIDLDIIRSDASNLGVDPVGGAAKPVWAPRSCTGSRSTPFITWTSWSRTRPSTRPSRS